MSVTESGESRVKSLNDNRRRQAAVNTVYHDREHPSHILLPLVKGAR